MEPYIASPRVGAGRKGLGAAVIDKTEEHLKTMVLGLVPLGCKEAVKEVDHYTHGIHHSVTKLDFYS